MIVDLGDKEYAHFRQARCTRDSVSEEYAALVIAHFATFHLRFLRGSEVVLMLYLLGVTACMKKTAEELSVRDLQDGGREQELGKGTGLSRTSVKMVLKSLAEKGYLTVYRRSGVGANESLPRIFEVNFSKITGQKLTPPGQNLTPAFNVSKDTYRRDIGELHSPSPAGAGTPTEGADMFVGKKSKQQAPRPTFATAAEAIASITKRREGLTASRVAAATAKTAGQVSKLELQALITKHMKAAGHDFVISVTNKEFGVLRKRMAEAGPADINDFIRYVMTYWTVIAEQNSRALRKERDRLVTNKPMPAAPDFGALAYRYPYFFKCYQNFLAERRTAEQVAQTQTEEGREIKRLRDELATEKKNVAILRRRTPSVPAAKPEPVRSATPARRSRMTTATTDDDLFGEAQFEEWK